jgi:hypothetical protein
VVGLIVGLGASSCATTLFVAPVGPGEPAPEASAAFANATASCRGVTSYKAQIRVSGRIGGERLPATINIATGVSPDGLLIEARGGGRDVFRLGATGDKATLYLDDGRRYAVGRPEALTEALIGVQIGIDRWRALLSGCGVTRATFVSGARYGTDLGATTPDGRVFLSAIDGVWRATHVMFDDLVVTYRRFAGDRPVEWQLTSSPERDPAIALTVRVDDATVNGPISPDVFTIRLPADATPMTIDELRDSGPLRRKR